MTEQTPKVYEAIARITAALASEGIAKDKRNTQQGYSFRGIDDVYNALARHLAANKLCILPRVKEREMSERESKSGGVLFAVFMAVEFDLVSAEDGSRHTVLTYGEAMDSGDKATNKAMSAAYKYMAMQVFCIPTEGDNDADATTHEVVAARQSLSVHKLPGDSTKWDGYGGRVLSEVPVATLKAAQKWLEKRNDPRNAGLLSAIALEIASRPAAPAPSLDTLPPGIEAEDKAPPPFLDSEAYQTALASLDGLDPDEMRSVVRKAAAAEKVRDKTLNEISAAECSGMVLASLTKQEEFARILVAIARRAQLSMAEGMAMA